jgi:hypothetical protein
MSYHRGGVNGPQSAYQGLVWAVLSVNELDPVPPFRMLVRCDLLDGSVIDTEIPMTAFSSYEHRAQWTIPPEVFAVGAYISYELVDTGEWVGNRSRMGYGYVAPPAQAQPDGSLVDTKVFIDALLNEFGNDVAPVGSTARGIMISVRLSDEQALVAIDAVNRPRLRVATIIGGVTTQVMLEPMQVVSAGNNTYRGWWQIPDSLYLEGSVVIEYNVFYEQGSNPVLSGTAPLKKGGKTQAEVDAAVAAAIAPFNASLQTIQLTNYQLGQEVQTRTAERDVLQLRVTELGTGAPTVGFVPALRTGAYTIKDFSVLDGIQRTSIGTYAKFDIDFVNVQLLSMKQGAIKMRRIAAIANTEFGFKFRTKIAKDMEYTAKKDNAFNQYLLESARIIEYAVDEVRNNQRFDLANTQFLRTIL